MIGFYAAGAMGSGGAAPAQYLDDLAPSPIAVYGLRKLVSTATVAIRVRRSSDNAEADIGFSGNNLDWAALASHVGAGSGYIRTIYDQTGNGRHAQQTTASKQPRIVNSGTPDQRIMFDGSDDALQITAFAFGTPYAGIFGDLRFTPTSSARVICELSANYNTNPYSFIIYANSLETGLVCGMHESASNAERRARGFPVSGTDVWAILMDRSEVGDDEIKVWRGTSSLTGVNYATTEQTGNFGTYPLYIGARGGTSLYCALELGSLVIYNTDTSAIRSQIQDILT